MPREVQRESGTRRVWPAVVAVGAVIATSAALWLTAGREVGTPSGGGNQIYPKDVPAAMAVEEKPKIPDMPFGYEHRRPNETQEAHDQFYARARPYWNKLYTQVHEALGSGKPPDEMGDAVTKDIQGASPDTPMLRKALEWQLVGDDTKRADAAGEMMVRLSGKLRPEHDLEAQVKWQGSLGNPAKQTRVQGVLDRINAPATK